MVGVVVGSGVGVAVAVGVQVGVTDGVGADAVSEAGVLVGCEVDPKNWTGG